MPKTELQLVINQDKTGKDAQSYCKSNATYVKKLNKTPITDNGTPTGKIIMYFCLIDIKRLVLDPSYQLETFRSTSAMENTSPSLTAFIAAVLLLNVVLTNCQPISTLTFPKKKKSHCSLNRKQRP